MAIESVSNVSGVRSDISEMLSKIRDISNKSQVFAENPISRTNSTQSFGDVLSMAKNSVSNVNDAVNQRDILTNAFVAGDTNVSMSQIIVASQKSKLAFEGLIAVRNKILEAYKEIMNMPI